MSTTVAPEPPSIGLNDARAPAETPWRGFVVAAVAALIVPVGYLGNEGISPLVALGGLLTLPWLLRPRLPTLGVWLLIALTVWAALSFLRSPVEPAQLANLHGYNHIQALVAPKLVFQLVLYGAFVDSALHVSPTWRGRALWALVISTVGIIAVLLIEGVEGGALYGALSDLVGQHWPPDLVRRNAARGSYGAAVLVWPCAAMLWRRDKASGAVVALVATAVGAALLGVDAPAAAILVAAGAFAVVNYFGRTGVWLCLAAAVAHFLLTPWLFLTRAATGEVLPKDVGKVSWHFRMIIWRFASGKAAERPLFGWGLDSSRAWPDQIPMHPHDAAIQLWLETGLVGAALAAAFWAWLFWRIAEVERHDRVAAAIMAATGAAYLVIGAISFGVWQEWWLALGAFAIAACAMLADARRELGRAFGRAELVELG